MSGRRRLGDAAELEEVWRAAAREDLEEAGIWPVGDRDLGPDWPSSGRPISH